MKKMILLLITITTFTNVSYASFPVLTTEKTEIAIESLNYQNPWYISVKNSILFLATSFFGLAALSVFIGEGFIVNDREGPIVLLLLPLLISIVSFFASVFYGKKVLWDRLSKKIVIWALSISAFFILLLNAVYAGGGMGG